MQGIYELGEQYEFKIIEDASNAIGGNYQNEPVGNSRYSDVTVLSFYPVKIITTGEGGMALTKDQEIHEHMKRLRSHGITSNSKHMTIESREPWYHEHIEMGFNCRMTVVHAVMELSQLERLVEFVVQRNELTQNYEEAFADDPIQMQVVPEETYSARHLYVIRAPKHQHLSLFEKFRGEGIGINLHYMPVHLQPYYWKLGFQEGDFPEAKKYGKEAIRLPMYLKLSAENKIECLP